MLQRRLNAVQPTIAKKVIKKSTPSALINFIQPSIVKVQQMFDYIFKNENLHFHSMGQCYVRGLPFPM